MKILFYISFIIACFSCKKKHNISIQANDLNNGSVNAYANMPFLISQSRPAWFEDKVDKVYEGVLDDNGFASFDLKMQKDWSYILSISQPENICHGGLVGFYLDNEKSHVVNFSYAKCGYVNLPHKNVSCENENDKFWWTFYYKNNPNVFMYTGWIDQGFNWSNNFLVGCRDFSDTKEYFAAPAGEYIVEWQVERTSTGLTTGSDNFTIYENDTTNYLIEY